MSLIALLRALHRGEALPSAVCVVGLVGLLESASDLRQAARLLAQRFQRHRSALMRQSPVIVFPVEHLSSPTPRGVQVGARGSQGNFIAEWIFPRLEPLEKVPRAYYSPF